MKYRDLDERVSALEKLLKARTDLKELMVPEIEKGDLDEGALCTKLNTVFICSLAQFRASYSLGADLEKLEEIAAEILYWYSMRPTSYGVPNQIRENYFDHLTVASICVLIEIDHLKLSLFSDKWKEWGVKDQLIELLIQSIVKSEEVSATLLFEDPYKTLVEVLENQVAENTDQQLKAYLRKWYGSHKNCYWHNRHKAKGPAYAGYWSFETAAVAKIVGLELDNSKLGHFFPYGFFGLPEQF